jgi:hypothetical protein
MSASYFKAISVDGAEVEFVLGEDVGGAFYPYDLIFKQGDDLYVAHDKLHDELVVCSYDGDKDVETRLPYSPHLSNCVLLVAAEGVQ